MNKRLILLFCLITFFILGTPKQVFAKRFRNSYISFELPKGWTCRLKGVSWFCTHNDKIIKREAQIVIVAKEAGPSDNLKVYSQYLKQPRIIDGYKSGTTAKSKPVHVKVSTIGNKQWVDSLHVSGEAEAYYTRYIGTVHKDLAIMATFTIHRNSYPYHSADILKAIKSITVVFNKSIIANSKSQAGRHGSPTGPLGNQLGSSSIDLDEGEELSGESSSSGSTTTTIIGLLLILGALVIYLLKKKKVL